MQTSPAAAEIALETCPLCQSPFDPSCAVGCGSCPMAKGCAALTCPNCGYSFPRPTGLSAMLARWLSARRARAARATGPLTLADAESGQRLRVLGFGDAAQNRLSKLASFGIVEGSELRVRQRHPAFIIEVGETTLALDGEVASSVHVRAAVD